MLVRNAVNVRKCCKDFIIRILFQAMWAYDFSQAGLQLVAWPTTGHAGLNELYYKYEKDQPAGAILKFVANKYHEVYGKDNRRVS